MHWLQSLISVSLFLLHVSDATCISSSLCCTSQFHQKKDMVKKSLICFYSSHNQILCSWSCEHYINFCAVARTIQNTSGYKFSSPAIITEGKKKAEKLLLRLVHGPQRRAEKGRKQASCVTGTSNHECQQPPGRVAHRLH